MIKIDKLFVSLLPSKHGGAGDYLDEILKYYSDYSKIIVPNFLKGIWILNRFLIIFFKNLYKFYLTLLLKFFSVNKLVIFHAQTISYKLSALLLLNSKDIEFYILDTNFFCKKSYNEYLGKPCFRCFEFFNPFQDCNHHPYYSNDIDYKKFIDAIKYSEKKITFIVQTKGYEKLLINKYPLAKVKILKMKHDGLIYNNQKQNWNIKNDKILNDFFFHAHLTNPKGLKYFLELSKKMSDKKFILPGYKEFSELTNNVVIKKISWGEVFIEELKKSKIILCPSVWTYPVESALIKSMLLKKAVAIIDIQNSFSKEIPNDCVIKLKGEVDNDSNTLNFFLNNNNYLQIANNGFNWAKNYLK